MHTEMWEHPSVQENLATLRRRGVHVLEPESGRLAGGDVGSGRLASPEAIVAAAAEALGPGDLAGLRVVVTAGGTREPIDAVRFVGNRSSGKQGHAVAEEAARRGASVALVTTTNRAVPAGIEVVAVETAAEMEEAVGRLAPSADVVVMAAAVADFRPKAVVDHKLKKADGVPEVVLEPTTDILAALGEAKPAGQTLVGFAAETSDVADHAAMKLARKRADIIVANDVSAPGVGFEHDTNAVLILTASGRTAEVGLTDKRSIARALLDLVVEERANGR
jgi:phosphopantothenoylcysteine decarboxylase/phosphopantothenate--cysteine ligase